MKILVIDDDPTILSTLEEGFRGDGFEVVTHATAEDGLASARTGNHDLLIIDIGLPDMNGLELVTRLRESGDPRPVIFLTARRSEEDIIRGLDLGADGYVPKPFSMEELKARVRALIRTRERAGQRHLRYGDIDMDLDRREVFREGKPIRLTEAEFRILMSFMETPGRIVSREELREELWGIRFDPGTTTLDVHISHLRKKLGTHGPSPIETVRSKGWRMRAPRE